MVDKEFWDEISPLLTARVRSCLRYEDRCNPKGFMSLTLNEALRIPNFGWSSWLVVEAVQNTIRSAHPPNPRLTKLVAEINREAQKDGVWLSITHGELKVVQWDQS